MRTVELLVIGGGPAGQAAAVTAAELGVQVLLVDEGPIRQSWMARQVPRWYGERLPELLPPDEAERRYRAARPGLAEAEQLGVEVRLGCACWGLFPGLLAGLYDGEQVQLVQARQIILATGSIEQPLPFSGWTLPGVLGGLGALDLLEAHGRLAGQRLVVLGAGSLGLSVARGALAAGHDVVAVADVAPQAFDDSAEWQDLAEHGVELIPGYTIVYADGNGQVERVLLAGIDELGRRIPGESFPVRADLVCVAIGRAPAVELAYLAGCALAYDERRGGHVPVHSHLMETTITGVLVAGDAAGCPPEAFADPVRAAEQGRRAAMAAAAALGNGRLELAAELVDDAPGDNGAASLGAWQRAALHLAHDDLVLCRCEGITKAEVLATLAQLGNASPNELKRVSRAGMGPCQGRGCRATIAALLAERGDLPVGHIPLASYRPPVRPVPLGAFAAIPPPEEALLPAFAALERQLEAEALAGLLPAARWAAARYKLQEESHVARDGGLDQAELADLVGQVGEAVRSVTVH